MKGLLSSHRPSPTLAKWHHSVRWCSARSLACKSASKAAPGAWPGVSYLQDDVIHIKVVLATAFMAMARKVIVLDYEQTAAEYVYATAALVLALSVAYWLVEVSANAGKPHQDAL